MTDGLSLSEILQLANKRHNWEIVYLDSHPEEKYRGWSPGEDLFDFFAADSKDLKIEVKRVVKWNQHRGMHNEYLSISALIPEDPKSQLAWSVVGHHNESFYGTDSPLHAFYQDLKRKLVSERNALTERIRQQERERHSQYQKREEQKKQSILERARRLLR